MTLPLPASPRYVPYRDVGHEPNIIADGAPLDSTVLNLSHWPVNDTPKALKQDTSTATVFAYLDSPQFHQDVDIVSNNHFDADGLFSMFTLIRPELALRHRALLLGAAMAGDFGVFVDRNAARLSFVIEAFADKRVSPLADKSFSGCEAQQTIELYQQMLDRLPNILDDLDAYRDFWKDQDAHLRASEALIENGSVSIEEDKGLDLAVVHIPVDVPVRTIRRYLQTERASIHPFAIHNATDCNRIIRVQGCNLELQYRYESWVQFVSRRPLLRADLDELAARLNAIEEAAGTWRAEKVTEVVPRLYLEGTEESSIPAAVFLAETRGYLVDAPAAWDPYNWRSDSVVD